MSLTLSKNTLEYPERTVKRAKQALSCSPFCLSLFQAMRNQSVPIHNIAGETGITMGYASKSLSEAIVEAKLVWLIKVGLLRREVDGQGLTDSFRLTPLGRQIIAEWEQVDNSLPRPSLIDRISNWLNRWLQWSF